MEQAGEVGAGRHSDAGERLLDGAGTTDAGAALNDKYALAGSREIGGAGEAVVAGADDDHIPRARREFADGRGKADFAQHGSSWRAQHTSTLPVGSGLAKLWKWIAAYLAARNKAAEIAFLAG